MRAASAYECVPAHPSCFVVLTLLSLAHPSRSPSRRCVCLPCGQHERPPETTSSSTRLPPPRPKRRRTSSDPPRSPHPEDLMHSARSSRLRPVRGRKVALQCSHNIAMSQYSVVSVSGLSSVTVLPRVRRQTSSLNPLKYNYKALLCLVHQSDSRSSPSSLRISCASDRLVFAPLVAHIVVYMFSRSRRPIAVVMLQSCYVEYYH